MAVYHLKYRPTKINELDSAEVRESLGKWLSESDPPRSFLFSGPKGSGKTSAARILSKSLNCLKKGKDVCGKCDNCREIESGRSMDIVELDGASNRGIEDVRSIKDKAYLLPSRLKYKVIIIDEVHMLTKEAFNALLKLIEEPPEKTVFVLCTTDPEKIPATVLSRLVRIDFKRGSREELVKSMERIVEGEELKVSAKVLGKIAEKSDGSFRNTARMLNEIVVSLGKEIKVDQLGEYLNKKGGDYGFEELVEDLAGGEIKKVLGRIEKMAEKGVDFSGYRQGLLAFLQKKLLAEYGFGEDKCLLGQRQISRLVNILIGVGKYEKEVEIGQLPLEMAIVEFVGEQEEGNPSRGGVNKEKEKKPIEVKKTKGGEEIGVTETIIETSEVVVGFGVEEVEKKWSEVLAAVKPFNHSVEAFLRAARPKEMKKGELVMEVFYPFHKDKLEEPRNRQIVEVGLEKVFGAKLLFKCVLGGGNKKALVIDNNYQAEEEKKEGETVAGDIYDVAKEIFG